MEHENKEVKLSLLDLCSTIAENTNLKIKEVKEVIDCFIDDMAKYFKI